jgi:hypothetical protein
MPFCHNELQQKRLHKHLVHSFSFAQAQPLIMKTIERLIALISQTAGAPLLVFAFVSGGQALAQVQDLKTQSGHELGVSLTNYKYDEPGYMQLNATKLGVSYSGTYVLGTTWPDPSASWFLRTDLHYGGGGADYRSPISGNLDNTPSRYMEARALIGKDIQMSGYVLSPYLGLGFRHLHSDLGYKRDSYYTTMPIGFIHKVKLDDRSQLLTSVEYMHLIRGVQKAKLPSQSLSLDQPKGYGLRFQMLKRYQNWSIGPVLTHWSLGASEIDGGWIEPRNKTTEWGIKSFYYF